MKTFATVIKNLKKRTVTQILKGSLFATKKRSFRQANHYRISALEIGNLIICLRNGTMILDIRSFPFRCRVLQIYSKREFIVGAHRNN